MKEIIYLDTDLIHSLLSQIHDGLPGETANERSQGIQEGTQSGTSGDSKFGSKVNISSGKMSVPLLFDTPEGKVELKLDLSKAWEESSAITQTEAGRELISKKLHDNALENLIQHLVEENMIQDINVAADNSFVKFNSSLQIFNLEYLSAILDPELLPKIMFHEINEEFEKQKREAEKITNKHDKNVALKKLKEAYGPVEENIKDAKRDFDFLNSGLNFMDALLPTKTFGKFNNSFAYIKSDHLREDPKVLMFKYANQSTTTKATIIGKKIRKIDVSEETPTNNSLFSAPLIIDNMLIEMEVANKGDYLIAPIAIYFE